MTTRRDTPSRRVHLRGHQVVSRTSAAQGGRFHSTVLLLDPHRQDHPLRAFQAYGPEALAAEGAALSQALEYLEAPRGEPEALLSSHTRLNVAGRQVEIFCDLVGPQSYQAFPFLRRSEGTLELIMQFHLREAITADSPAAAIARCARRLEDYFADQRAALAAGGA